MKHFKNWLILALILGLFLIGNVCAQEPDYKKLYLEQKIQAIQLEIRNMQLRFSLLQRELALNKKALGVYSISLEAEKAKLKDKEVPKAVVSPRRKNLNLKKLKGR